MQYLDTISKTTEYLCSFPRQTIQYHSIQVYAPTSNAETPGVTGKFGLGLQNEARQRLIEFCQENALVIANTLFQQHKRRLYTWTSPDGQHQNQMDYILSSQRWRSSIQSAKTRPGADCGLDHELSEVAQSCPTLSDPMDCSLLCSSVHGIFQARILEWVAISFSRGSS